ncbi:MAG: UDP-galactopyranose mutase [Coriobacteriales bacterium]|jgi:UDP-galactopyranose mutase
MNIVDTRGELPHLSDYDAIIIGAGFAGSVVARELAERAGKKVAIVESRNHIGGNAYDKYDDAGVLIHAYGPHIFHTNDARAYEYLSKYTEWLDYQHEVLANLNGTYIPVPFNKNSIDTVFDHDKAERYINKLVETFGDERKVPIIELRKKDDPELAEIADFVYNNVFLYYTQKQWGLTPEEVDPSVTARVPVFISRDNRYFQDKYQGMPLEGYTKLFENMLDHDGIDIYLSTDGRDILEFEDAGDGKTIAKVDRKPFEGTIVYTGAIDELFGNRFGRLPYRSLNFVYETYPIKHWQPCGTVNYTVSEDYTRITEFTYMTGQDLNVTTIMKEYSLPYEGKPGQIPYYAIISEENQAHYNKYKKLADGIHDFHLIGRLAEYRYYNMDAIVSRALELADQLCG